jgi:hypothetical protein
VAAVMAVVSEAATVWGGRGAAFWQRSVKFTAEVSFSCGGCGGAVSASYRVGRMGGWILRAKAYGGGVLGHRSPR